MILEHEKKKGNYQCNIYFENGGLHSNENWRLKKNKRIGDDNFCKRTKSIVASNNLGVFQGVESHEELDNLTN